MRPKKHHDENPKGGGGPGGVRSPGSMTLEEATTLFDLNKRGAGKAAIDSKLPSSLIRSLGVAGWIEEGARGKVILTAGGVAALTTAAQLIAASPSQSR